MVIRDGWGHGPPGPGNAISLAKTPNDDRFLAEYPHVLLGCGGNFVGLPDGTMGGSEVGHLTMGAGRVVWQPYEKINKAVKDGSFYENPALNACMDSCMQRGTKLHLMGLFSDEGVHADFNHIAPLIKMASSKGISKVFVHAFLDGRDVPEKSFLSFLEQFEAQCSGKGVIASIVGRYYAMDRDTNWGRTQEAYLLLTEGKGFKAASAKEAIQMAYERGDPTDYYVKPTAIVREGKPVATIKEGDSVIFFNFRSDRARQITNALAVEGFSKFPAKRLNLSFVCFSEYDREFHLPVAFPQEQVSNNLGKVLADNGIKQLRAAETEKYAHVTFFFNSQIETPNEGEDRILVPSPKVPSYDQKPEMSAYEVTDKVMEQIEQGKHDVMIVNFANPDLVGHSGVLDAAVKACEVVDECAGRLVDSVVGKGGMALLLADHGNSDAMTYPDGSANPAHSLNPVMLTLIANDMKGAKLREGCGLASVAPTILKLLSIKIPQEMDAPPLF